MRSGAQWTRRVPAKVGARLQPVTWDGWVAGDNEGDWKGGSIDVVSDLGVSLVVFGLGRAEEEACRMVVDGSWAGSGASRVAVRRW